MVSVSLPLSVSLFFSVSPSLSFFVTSSPPRRSPSKADVCLWLRGKARRCVSSARPVCTRHGVCPCPGCFQVSGPRVTFISLHLSFESGMISEHCQILGSLFLGCEGLPGCCRCVSEVTSPPSVPDLPVLPSQWPYPWLSRSPYRQQVPLRLVGCTGGITEPGRAGPAPHIPPSLPLAGFLCPLPSQGVMVQSLCLWRELGCQTLQALLLAGPASWGPNPSQRRAGQQWSGPALAPRRATSLQHRPSQGRAGDCVRSPCAPPPTPTPPGVNLGASTEPLCFPTCEESWGRHTPSITLGCAYILETE